ncbi:hypothetical protein C0995_001803 [Termitomyces sp. Mi166|nr:hypothetical protein C0995_001803 [Termitomyces sp. Mi166\
MFARVSSVLALALCASASVVPRTGVDQCNTGSLQCCNSVQDANSSAVSLLTGLLGIVLGPVTGQVGCEANQTPPVTCDPISVIGASGDSCSSQPVCCTGNNFNGLIVVGCTPVNLNL